MVGIIYLAEESFRDKSLKRKHTCPMDQSETEKAGGHLEPKSVKGLTAYSESFLFL